jgi:hypothetical protein
VYVIYHEIGGAREQLTETVNTRHPEAFFTAVERLQAEQSRSDRRELMKLRDDEIPFTAWNDDQRKTVERVAQNYDVIGIMVRYGMLPREIILDSWGNSIWECWAAADEFLEHRKRERGNKSFWNDFKLLADEAVQWAKDHKVYEPKGRRAIELWGEAVV